MSRFNCASREAREGSSSPRMSPFVGSGASWRNDFAQRPFKRTNRSCRSTISALSRFRSLEQSSSSRRTFRQSQVQKRRMCHYDTSCAGTQDGGIYRGPGEGLRGQKGSKSLCPIFRSTVVLVEVKLSGSVSPAGAARIVAVAQQHACSSGPDRVRKESQLLDLLVGEIKKPNLAIRFPEGGPDF